MSGIPHPVARIKALLSPPRMPWRLRQAIDKWQLNAARTVADRRALSTPPSLTGQDNPDFEIHLLLGKRYVGMTLWAIKSLLHWSGKAYSVVLHDDGSLDDKDLEILNKHLVNSRVILHTDADTLMAEKLKAYPNAYKYRFSRLGPSSPPGKPSVFSKKLLDFSLLSNARKILVLDSDVLFFKRPDAIIDWINDQANRDCLYCFELYLPIRNSRNRIIRFEKKTSLPLGFNSGLICFERSAFNLALLDDWLGQNKELADTVYTFEQRAYNHLVKSYAKHRPLPETYSFNFNDPGHVATHFGIKQLFFSNLPRVRKALMVPLETKTQ